ncbi:HAMP domain-containing histidine kinase, partial [Arthrobacter deserti]|nr:HAMP domain-containing histidine kinase [Arthrobacter deserti]
NAKNEFLSSVSHELRTPLTSIRGYAGLLSMTACLPANVAYGREVITRNPDQLLNLVNDLLGTAAGFTELHAVRTVLADIVSQAVAAAGPRASASGVRLLAHAPDSVHAQCDPARVRQVLDNLLSNAIKYSPQGGTATVSCALRNGTAECKVEDTGMGISAQDSKEIFTRFFRSPAARKSSIPGLGLGLALSRDIVQRHGGTIWCDSQPGAGSVFTFTLPAAGPGAGTDAASLQAPRGTDRVPGT